MNMYLKSPSAMRSSIAASRASGFTREAKVTLHFKKLYGKNTHHIIEGVFKAFARVLKKAVAIDPTQKGIPSSKGVL